MTRCPPAGEGNNALPANGLAAVPLRPGWATPSARKWINFRGRRGGYGVAIAGGGGGDVDVSGCDGGLRGACLRRTAAGYGRESVGDGGGAVGVDVGVGPGRKVCGSRCCCRKMRCACSCLRGRMTNGGRTGRRWGRAVGGDFGVGADLSKGSGRFVSSRKTELAAACLGRPDSPSRALARS